MYSFKRRQKRGAALIATVLIVLAAASIALIIVTGGLNITKAESNKLAARNAKVELQNMQTAFEAELLNDPSVFLKKVSTFEKSRTCAATGSVYPAGSNWPKECGSSWSYQNFEEVNPNQGVRSLEISAPTPGDPLLTVRYAVSTKGVKAGNDVTYSPDALNRPLLADATSLRIDQTVDANSASTLAGLLYSPGLIELPAGGSSDAVYVSGSGFTGPQSENNTYVTPENKDFTRYSPSVTNINALRASIAGLKDVACSFDINKSICLSAENLNSEIVIPENVTAWRVSPQGDATGQNIAISYTVEAVPDPNNASSWLPLGAGIFSYPSTGVLFADADVFVDQESPFGLSLNIVAGSPSEPKNVIVLSDLSAVNKNALALTASGSVIIPPYAPALTITADVKGLALNNSTGIVVDTPTPNEAKVTINGALTGNNINTPAHLGALSFNQNPELLKAPAPYSSLGVINWSPIETSQISASDLQEMF